jgi:RNA polymerase sigma-70 factor (ECF subfamily)
VSHTALSTSAETFPTSLDDDEFLVARCCLGEEAAFLAVYKKYAPAIFRLCFGFLQHQEDAEEVVQDTFEYAFRKIDRYETNKASFKTWLYQIAISRCRNKRRRKFLKTLPFSKLFGETVRDASQPAPLEIAINNEEQEKVWKALHELSPKIRETVYLRYYEALTYREIGTLLGIPAKTAESRMRLAHASLRKLLGKE